LVAEFSKTSAPKTETATIKEEAKKTVAENSPKESQEVVKSPPATKQQLDQTKSAVKAPLQ
jgi:hypothetical protein